MPNDLTIEFLEDSHLYIRSGGDDWCIVLDDDQTTKAVEKLVEKLRLSSFTALKKMIKADKS